MSIQIKDAEIKSILAEVQASLQAAKKSEAEKLSKALDGDESPGEAPHDEASESAAPAAPEASESAPAESPEMNESPAADAVPADSAPVDPAMAADPAAEQSAPADPAMLAQEYAKLDDDQLKSHYMACKQAVFERMKVAASGGPDALATPGPDASAAASAPPAAAMKAEVSESSGGAKSSGIATDGKVAPVTPTGSQKLDQATGPGANLSAKTVATSEASRAGNKIEAEVAKSEDERDQVIEGLVKAVNLLVNGSQPIRKAVTSVAILERTEQLEKSEPKSKKTMAPDQMKGHLSELIRTGKLNKNEKAAVLAFYETKDQAHLEKIAHLFE